MPNTGSPSDRRRIPSASEKADSARAKGSTKKAAGKKAAAKKPMKKAAAKKAATKKSTKNASTRKPTRKSATKKAATKKSTKKAATKKAATKKAATKKSTKKVATKKSATKKAATKKSAKKVATKKSTRRSAKHKPTTITRRVSRKRPTSRSRAAKPLIGWREWVVLPEFTSTPIKAKVDSGAVTSSLHAFNLQITTGGGQTTARFGVAPKQGSHAAKTTVEHAVIGFKKVRSSNGQAELRPVIRTVAMIGDETFEIDITLASRDAMGFRMLLGRRAVRNRFVIDPGRSFLQPASSDVDQPIDQ